MKKKEGAGDKSTGVFISNMTGWMIRGCGRVGAYASASQPNCEGRRLSCPTPHDLTAKSGLSFGTLVCAVQNHVPDICLCVSRDAWYGRGVPNVEMFIRLFT